jgi:hypothetical protein
VPDTAWDMDWLDAEALFRYWIKYPPAHLLLRAELGYEAPEERQRRPEAAHALQNFGKMIQKQGRAMKEKDLPPHMKQFLKEFRSGKHQPN